MQRWAHHVTLTTGLLLFASSTFAFVLAPPPVKRAPEREKEAVAG